MKTTTPIVFLALALALFTNCKDKTSKKKKETPAKQNVQNTVATKQNNYTTSISNTHEQETYLNYEAVKFELSLNVNGKSLKAELVQATNTNTVKLSKANGNQVFFTKDGIYAYPENYKPSQLEKQAVIWAYLNSLPQKIASYQLNWSEKRKEVLQKDTLQSAKYISKGKTIPWLESGRIYSDKNTNLVKAAVLQPKDKKTAAFAILYSDYYTTKKIPVCKTWEIYNWNSKTEKLGKQIGEASLNNIQFLSSKKDLFELPKKAQKTAL